jgi:cathepsin C
MMKELYTNGPFVVSYEPDYNFMFYKSGIYRSTNCRGNIQQGRPEWEKVDHSVLLVGWGEENGVRYWLVQNTWGDDWGEGGYFRIVRGVNEMAIESSCEIATPVIFENKNKIIIHPNKNKNS